MNEVIIISISIIMIILLKIGFNIRFKDIKELNNRKNEELMKLGNKIPSDEEICREILDQKGKKEVKIKINKEYDSCLYTVYNNTITIGKFKEDYIKLQTIAHECIHACQERKALWFNFIISNVYNIYFFIISILAIFKTTNNTLLTIVLLMLSIVKIIVRMYLENEAMNKAKYEAKKYIEENKLLTKDEEEKLLKEYDYINKIGIPFYNYIMITNELTKVIFYNLLLLVIMIIN